MLGSIGFVTPLAKSCVAFQALTRIFSHPRVQATVRYRPPDSHCASCQKEKRLLGGRSYGRSTTQFQGISGAPEGTAASLGESSRVRAVNRLQSVSVWERILAQCPYFHQYSPSHQPTGLVAPLAQGAILRPKRTGR